MDTESLIDACLKTDPTHPSPALVELERSGPVAYGALKARLSSGSLKPTQTVKAIRAYARPRPRPSWSVEREQGSTQSRQPCDCRANAIA